MIESEYRAMSAADMLRELTSKLGIPFIYKSSFDRANRSCSAGFRGPVEEEGLRILSKAKVEFGVSIITDVHEDTALDEIADGVDVLQSPAFLCRQTNFIERVARTNTPIIIKWRLCSSVCRLLTP